MDSEPQWLDEQQMRSWRAYVLTKPMLEAQLHRELADEHDVSLVDYDILVRLSENPQRRMRMSDLADEVGASKSKVSHQIDRLERSGMVCRSNCGGDGRGVYAELTDYGMEKLRSAAPTHVRGVRTHFVDLITDDELVALQCAFARVSEHLRRRQGRHTDGC